MRDRGQSETLGFLLIFSVVIITVGLVITTGFVGLENARDFQRTTNAEQAFLVLANNVDDLVREGAPGRTTEVRIADASLSLTETTTTVTVTNATGTTNETIRTDPIVYDSGSETTITYRNGAVIRQDDGNPVMLRNPRFVLTEEAVVLPMVDTVAQSGRVGGTTEVGVRTLNEGTTVLVSTVANSTVTLNVSSPRAEVWERYFETFEGNGAVTNVDRNGNNVEVTVETKRVYVTVTRVAVRFQ